MTTICAWCNKILKVTTDHPDLVSHGICDKCADEMRQTRKKVPR